MYPKIKVSSHTQLGYADGEYVIQCHLGYLTTDFTEDMELSKLVFDKDLSKAFQFTSIEVEMVFELLKPYSVFATFEIKQLDFTNYIIIVTDNGKFFPNIRVEKLSGGLLKDNESVVHKSFYSDTENISDPDELLKKVSKHVYSSHFKSSMSKIVSKSLIESTRTNPNKIKDFKFLTLKVTDSKSTLVHCKVKNLGIYFSGMPYSDSYPRQVIELEVVEFENIISPFYIHKSSQLNLIQFFDLIERLKNDLITLQENNVDFKVEFITEC